MKFQMEVMIADLIFVSKDYQHRIEELKTNGDILKQQLSELLPTAMAEIDDPDTRDKSPDKYIDNLFNNKLGNFEKRVILISNYNHERTGIIIALPETEALKSYHIFTIGVNKEFRCQGIGEELLKALAEKLRKKGIEKLVLDVHKQNVKAIKFYKRLGFTS